MALSSINTGLQQTPDLTDIASPGKLGFQFIQLYNAIGILQQAVDSYTGNTPAPADNSNQNATPEQTVLVGNTSTIWATANTNISAGFLVNLINVSGAAQVKYANAISAAAPCYGISMGAASAGQKVQVLLLGLFNFGGSVIPGQIYYLSASVAGGITTIRPATSGNIVQAVGFGVDTNSMFFNPTLLWQQL